MLLRLFDSLKIKIHKIKVFLAWACAHFGAEGYTLWLDIQNREVETAPLP